MKNLEKLSLKRALGVLSEKELKNVLGGSGGGTCYHCMNGSKHY